MHSSSEGEAELRARVRRQEAVADLGQRALEIDELDRLLTEAAATVADVLGADYCGVFEVEPSGDEARLRQGVGWRDGVVGEATVPLQTESDIDVDADAYADEQDSHIGAALRSSEPVVVPELRSDAGGPASMLLADHDVASAIVAAVGSADEPRPWGVLGVYATDPAEFADRDIEFVRDVTDVLGPAIDQVDTERRLRERELATYETILEAINDGIYVKDEDGRFTMVNDAYASMTGYSRETLIGEHASLVVDEETIARSETVRAAMADDDGEQNPTMEAAIHTADGDEIPAEATFATLETDDGETRQIGVVRDISERRERERALERSERRYRTLAENVPNGAVGVYDETLTYTLAEGAVLGDRLPSAERLEGSRMSEIYPPDTVTDLEPLFRAAVEDGETGSATTEYGGRDWRVWAAPLRDSDGEIFAGLSLAQDVTEQVERERRLEELVDELETSNERLEQFAYAASHDLQEPLRMVSTYLQLIESRYADALDEEGREFLAFAVDGADRMREMIEGLLAYSRVDTQGEPFEPVDLEDVFADAVENLRVRIEETDAEITADPLPRVRGDETQLRQVFQNLLSNAIEYSGDEPPRVHVTATRDDAPTAAAPADGAPSDEAWRVVSIRDEGIGIDSDDEGQIFDIFQRLHSVEDHDGAGIGLALCERIIERHGGEIRVDSEPGEGATFTFTLPPPEGDET